MTSTTKQWQTDPVSLQKKELRKNIAARLANVSAEEVRRQSDIVIDKVLSSSWFKNARRMSVYVHTSGEVETDRIVLESLKQGKQLFIPKFAKGNLRMRLLRVPSQREFLELKPTLWGIRQPDDSDCWEDHEDTGALDLILMPGVAFTTDGCRLGHGMGYYDRALAAHQQQFGAMPAIYGLALTQQIVDQVPLSETDVKLDGVIKAD
ncbi:5-formyltetrahydrofolate cyclo-ligase [Trichostrongylus colubriformis]|uniref:5-formyltetrahydrofolate cyclo-ligase n=1 Tax=Trichostrongylus colubriformis TaxID=6319 RepID=A0AAN8F5I1_TRICO